MSDQVNLTDDELRAANQAGRFKDPAILGRLDSDSRRRLTRIQGEGPKETTDPEQAMRNSRNDTMRRTALGIGQGAIDTVNPVNAAQGFMQGLRVMSGDPMAAMEAGQGIIDTAKAIASGDPDVGGRMIGSLLMGGFGIPRVAGAAGPRIGQMAEGIQGTGRALEAAGDVSRGPKLKMAGKAMQMVPTPKAVGYEQYMPNVSAGSQATAEAATPMVGQSAMNEMPLYQQMEHLPQAGGIVESARAGGPVRTTPEIGAQHMADSILEAATTPGSPVKLSQWQQQFLQSIGDQVKAGGRISPRQAQVLAEMYSTFGLAK